MGAGRGARAAGVTRALLVSLALAAVGASAGLTACGEEDERISDARIVGSLKLEELDSGYAIGGDPFCAVNDLLNDEAEVDEALDGEVETPVVTSKAGNVGIEAAPPFGPDCQRQARKRLNKLDPAPKE